jgi:hypothetical protein
MQPAFDRRLRDYRDLHHLRAQRLRVVFDQLFDALDLP